MVITSQQATLGCFHLGPTQVQANGIGQVVMATTKTLAREGNDCTQGNSLSRHASEGVVGSDLPAIPCPSNRVILLILLLDSHASAKQLWSTNGASASLRGTPLQRM